jgi:sensor histidine kinase regulating citrate/malate metabolism
MAFQFSSKNYTFIDSKKAKALDFNHKIMNKFNNVLENFLEQYFEHSGIRLNIKYIPGRLVTNRLVNNVYCYVGNAIDSVFMRSNNEYYKGKVKMNISADEHIFRFEVEDNGIGIDSDVENGLFKIINSKKMGDGLTIGGVGMCLYNTKISVNRLSGKCGYEDKGKNQGAIFWFEIPIDQLVKKYAK